MSDSGTTVLCTVKIVEINGVPVSFYEGLEDWRSGSVTDLEFEQDEE